MFPFPKSSAKRALDQAEDLLRLADKVDCYRRDVVPAPALATLRAASARLQQLWEQKAHPEILEKAADELHAAMLPCGGDIYPLTFASEYTEMIISAAILVIGFRTFFLEPFKIPTNSMYPTYNGMTPYVYAIDQPGPNPLAQVFNLIVQGATHHELRAPAAGEVIIPLDDGPFTAHFEKVGVRSWSHLWLSADADREYRIFVGGQAVTDRVPMDFDYGFDQAIYETYFPDLYQQAQKDVNRMPSLLAQGGYIHHDEQGRVYLDTGHKAQAGEPILNFDLRTGDMLFVDRFSYNFIAPKVGDPIVFHTSGIKDLYTVIDGVTTQEDQNYIKRLVGGPGDVLEVHPPMLYRNGQPNTGAAAFDKNGHKVENYPGYTFGNGSAVLLQSGHPFTVPSDHYFAMGDNSPTSYDGRYWGPVPAQNIVGRAVVIIYPFTFRWGLAK